VERLLDLGLLGPAPAGEAVMATRCLSATRECECQSRGGENGAEQRGHALFLVASAQAGVPRFPAGTSILSPFLGNSHGRPLLGGRRGRVRRRSARSVAPPAARPSAAAPAG